MNTGKTFHTFVFVFYFTINTSAFLKLQAGVQRQIDHTSYIFVYNVDYFHHIVAFSKFTAHNSDYMPPFLARPVLQKYFLFQSRSRHGIDYMCPSLKRLCMTFYAKKHVLLFCLSSSSNLNSKQIYETTCT